MLSTITFKKNLSKACPGKSRCRYSLEQQLYLVQTIRVCPMSQPMQSLLPSIYHFHLEKATRSDHPTNIMTSRTALTTPAEPGAFKPGCKFYVYQNTIPKATLKANKLACGTVLKPAAFFLSASICACVLTW